MSIKQYGDRIFVLQTKNTSYALSANPNGDLRHLYWGEKIERIEDFASFGSSMEEYSSYGCVRNKFTALKIAFHDRTRDFRPNTCKQRVEGDTLSLILRDAVYGFEVELFYRVHEEYDIIERWCEIRNTEEDWVRLERAFSAEIGLPGEGYTVLNYKGSWGCEQQVIAEPVLGGKVVFESIVGLTAHGNNPFFAAYRQTYEDHGDVYFGTLAYSGNFKVTAEALPSLYTNICIGMNDTDFSWTLGSGEKLETPHAYLGFTPDGLTGMTHRLTDFAFAKVMPQNFAKTPLPVLYNSWYATEFRVNAEEQMKLADKAAAVGCELFMIDDGWFGERNSDRAGLGDWVVNKEKFPRGLGELIDHCHSLGMQFGLWIEPEMVNPDSDLYRAHPDWIFRYDTRPAFTGRNQYVLNLTKPEVVDYLISMLDALLCENEISCIKWDMNRYLSETLSASGDDGRVWREYNDSFEKIIKTLRQRHPDVQFEACSSGGGRVDWGTMRNFDMYWPSDNVDAVDRLAIQEGYSLIYPIKYMRAWVTDSGREPLLFRFHSSMCGALGIGSNLNNTSESDLKIMKEAVAQYKRIRNTVQFGRLYRLESLKNGTIQALSYVNGGDAVLFVFQVHQPFYGRRYTVRLKGLEPDAVYSWKNNKGEETRLSGAYLMGKGIELPMNGDYASCIFEIHKEN